MLKFNFITKEPEIYNNIYRNTIEGHAHHDVTRLYVPFGSSKNVQDPKYNPKFPLTKYLQGFWNIFAVGSLESVLDAVGEALAEFATVGSIGLLLKYFDEVLITWIACDNEIMTGSVKTRERNFYITQ